MNNSRMPSMLSQYILHHHRHHTQSRFHTWQLSLVSLPMVTLLTKRDTTQDLTTTTSQPTSPKLSESPKRT